MKYTINLLILLIAYISIPVSAGTYEDQLETFRSMSISEIKHTSEYKNAVEICRQSDAGTPESCRERLVKFINNVGRTPATDSEVGAAYGCWEYDPYVCPDSTGTNSNYSY